MSLYTIDRDKSAVNCCSGDLHTLLASVFQGLPDVLAGFTKCFQRPGHASSALIPVLPKLYI